MSKMPARLAAKAARFYDGVPPFDLTEVPWPALSAQRVPVDLDAVTAVRTIRDLDVDTAERVVRLLRNPDAVRAVFDRDRRKAVRHACATTRKLDRERLLASLPQFVKSEARAVITSIVSQLDPYDAAQLFADDDSPVGHSASAAMIEHAVAVDDPALWRQVLLSKSLWPSSEVASAFRAFLASGSAAQTDAGDLIAFVAVGHRRTVPGREYASLTSYTLERILQCQDPDVLDVALDSAVLAPLLVPHVAGGSTPLDPEAALDAGRVDGWTDAVKREVTSLLRGGDCPVTSGLLPLAKTVYERQQLPTALAELAGRLTPAAARVVAADRSFRWPAVALGSSHLTTAERDELLDRLGDSDIPGAIGALTAGEVRRLTDRDGATATIVGALRSARLFEETVELTGPLRVLLEVAAGDATTAAEMVQIVASTHWTPQLALLACRTRPDVASELFICTQLCPEEYRDDAVAGLDAELLAELLETVAASDDERREPLDAGTLTVDDVTMLLGRDPELLRSAVAEWCKTTTIKVPPAWLEVVGPSLKIDGGVLASPVDDWLISYADRRLGADPAAWQVLLALVPTWESTLEELISTAGSLA